MICYHMICYEIQTYLSATMIWKAIEEDEVLASTAIERYHHGEPIRKRTRLFTTKHHTKLQNLCLDYITDKRNLQEFLKALGYYIRP